MAEAGIVPNPWPLGRESNYEAYKNLSVCQAREFNFFIRDGKRRIAAALKGKPTVASRVDHSLPPRLNEIRMMSNAQFLASSLTPLVDPYHAPLFDLQEVDELGGAQQANHPPEGEAPAVAAGVFPGHHVTGHYLLSGRGLSI
mmetsp:Transcript_22479/g.55399  ORF Transcript_22479/g.55399 Transcript_22479/m.55399 type:complete len:143 (+) Transcript_22479:76-504(+)